MVPPWYTPEILVRVVTVVSKVPTVTPQATEGPGDPKCGGNHRGGGAVGNTTPYMSTWTPVSVACDELWRG